MPKYKEKNLYQITVEGCDDSTMVEMSLSTGELSLLESLSSAINKESKYVCEPRLVVERLMTDKEREAEKRQIKFDEESFNGRS